MKAKRLECIYCHMAAIWTVRFETYVCDDCYKKNQEEKKNEMLKQKV